LEGNRESEREIALMNRTVVKKQPNSKMCFLCGLKNDRGVKVSFFELDNNELVALFTPQDEYQGYPDRLHGAITMGLLDETIGRAIMMHYKEDFWGVTVEFTTRFKKPIPLNVELRVVGRITKDSGRLFEGTGELILPNGDIAAAGRGRYMKIPLSTIADFDPEAQEWSVVIDEDDPDTVELP
jgi:acyl-coenzyme A thioesterase PaaI-like protein